MMYEVGSCLRDGREKSKLNFILNILIIVLAVAFIFEIIFSLNYSGIYVVGDSMLPNFVGAQSENSVGGDYIYVNKYAEPYYGAIVVAFKNDNADKNRRTTIIKRVVAMGGDCVKLNRGKLMIKYAGETEFKEVPESYIAEGSFTPSLAKNNFCNNNDGFFVEEGCVFLLGDNRDISEDSRANGGINFPLEDIYGVAPKWSLNHKSFITSVHKYFKFDLPRFFGLA